MKTRSNRRALRLATAAMLTKGGLRAQFDEIVSNVETSDHDSLLGRQLFMMRPIGPKGEG